MKMKESDDVPDANSPERNSGDDEPPDFTTMDLRSSVLTLAFPAVMRKGLQSLVEMMSLIIVGSLGAEAIAAVGVGKRVIMMSTAIFQALSVGATAIVARHIGAGDRKATRRVVTQAILFAGGIGLCVALVGVLLSPMLMRGMMSLQEAPDLSVIQQGTVYLRNLSVFYVFAIPLFMANAVMQGAGDMKTPLYLMAYMNITNVSLAYLLVHGVGPFPEMGVAGAGLAAGIGRGSAGLIALWILATNRTVIGMDLSRILEVDWGVIRSVVNIGLPAAVEKFVRRGSQIIYTMLIASMGTAAIAANSITMSIRALSFIPGFGFGLAATALVGQNLGAKKPGRAERSGYEACKYTVILVALMGSIFLFAPRFVTSFYSADPDVVNLTVICLRIIAISTPFLAVIQVFSGALRGAGDTRVIMLVNVVGDWGIRLLGSYILGIHMGMGLVGVWIAMALEQVARGLVLFARFRMGAWKGIQIDRSGPPAKDRGETPTGKVAVASSSLQRAGD